jgi:hypothetical protein
VSVSITVASALPDTIACLFPHDEHGHIIFGFAGRTIEPQSRDALTDSSVRVRDYMMERFVAYSVRLVPSESGTTILIEDVSDDRDADVEWFAKKYVESKHVEIVPASQP